jgi:hypothetical protein
MLILTPLLEPAHFQVLRANDDSGGIFVNQELRGGFGSRD